MKQIRVSNKFKKDYTKLQKQGKNIKKLKAVIDKLADNQTLESNYRVHKLTGNYSNTLEYHIEPDWLLIFINAGEFIELIRTGSHSELFE